MSKAISLDGKRLIHGLTANGTSDNVPVWSDITTYVGASPAGLTAGSVPYSNGAGGLAQFNAAFFFDASAAQLKIGTNDQTVSPLFGGAVLRLGGGAFVFDMGRDQSLGYLKFQAGAASADGFQFVGFGNHPRVTIQTSGVLQVHGLSAGGVVVAGNATGEFGLAINSADLAAVSGINSGDQLITLTGDVTGSGNGTFTATVAHVSFTVVQTALAAATSAVSVNGAEITNVLSPTASSSAATKGYVDALVLGLDIKPSARALSASNIASLSGLSTTVDGIALSTDGQRVNLTAQSTGAENGLWVVHSGAWTRPTDFAVGSSAAGAFVFIEQGTLYADTGWVCTANTPSDVVGTHVLPFVQFSSAGVFSNADGTIVFTGADVRRAAITGDVGIPAGSNTATIASNAVTNAKFRQGAATSVVGVAGGSTANIADIAATGNAQFLGQHSGSLGFAAITVNDLPNQVTLPDFVTLRVGSNFPTNGFSLGSLASGVLQQTTSGAVSTPSTFAVGAGLVAFGAASGGGLATDSVIVVDTTNHRFGAGTATPGYTVEVSGMTRLGGATGINQNPDTEAFAYLQTQITGDRDRAHFRVGGAGTALASTGSIVAYSDWDVSSTSLATASTIAALFTHRFRAQAFSASSATITDNAPATVVIDGPPTFSGGMTAPVNVRALRVKAGNVSIDTGDLIMGTGNISLPTSGVGHGNIDMAGDLTVGHAITAFSATLGGLTVTSSVDLSTASTDFRAQVAPGAGAPATLGTIGGSGPAVATMSGWAPYRCNGVNGFVPFFV